MIGNKNRHENLFKMDNGFRRPQSGFSSSNQRPPDTGDGARCEVMAVSISRIACSTRSSFIGFVINRMRHTIYIRFESNQFLL